MRLDLLNLTTPFKKEYKIWLLGSIFIFFISYIIIYGFNLGLDYFLNVPAIYYGDGKFGSWYVQRILEGWVYYSPRNGYPFGGDFIHYPLSDNGSFLIIKLLGYIFSDFWVVFKVYYLLGFSFVFISSYLVIRSLNINIFIAFCSSIVFSLLPYHIDRIDHTFLSFYVSVPPMFYLAFHLFRNKGVLFYENSIKKNILLCVGLVALSSFGVYYAFFGCILISSVGFIGGILNKKYTYIIKSLLISSVIAIGVIINFIPNYVLSNSYSVSLNSKELSIYNKEENQKLIRYPSNSELFSLKFAQLILPRTSHRIAEFSHINSVYNKTSYFVNENVTSSLGILGSLGILLIFMSISSSLLCNKDSKNYFDNNTKLFSFIFIILFMFATFGGLGSVFSYLLTPLIRSWNRLSVFIGFTAIVPFFIFINYVVNKIKLKYIRYGVISILTCLAILDQTPRNCLDCHIQRKSDLEIDRKFVSAIEKSLPKGSAIYQLPYIPFPEPTPLIDYSEDALKYGLGAYDNFIGFLHSKDLKWSYGVEKGSFGDFFFKKLSTLSLKEQIDIARELGFSGVYLDLRGFSGQSLRQIKILKESLGEPNIVSSKNKRFFWKIEPDKFIGDPIDHALKIARDKQFFKEYKNDDEISEIVYFNHPFPTNGIVHAVGLSDVEPWGRWSDGPVVSLHFDSSLPRRLKLIINITPYGPNDGKKFKVKIGQTEHSFFVWKTESVYEILFDLNSSKENQIDFIIPEPSSPKELGIGSDTRKLGIGFSSIQIVSLP
ncbi:DUF7024 domain-containing protein [Vibrio sp. MEBiC08052]|uniref:DUF7024 domain-containing protein n=1 Tax=Vibrio sp. MEBiC08052 TaxID=1761910 RepID=UPI00074083F7|nr:hypothetical protein [Vibrio sp. MEBiC08052]KUJ00621.1 hypothetical protein VRK_01230 [Vibrio sp. MEBiC08052]